MTKSLNLTLSIFSFVFIAGLVYISHLKYQISSGVLSVALEMLTIPIILMILILLVINAITWSKEKWSFTSPAFYALVPLALSVVTMIFATIYNI